MSRIEEMCASQNASPNKGERKLHPVGYASQRSHICINAYTFAKNRRRENECPNVCSFCLLAHGQKQKLNEELVEMRMSHTTANMRALLVWHDMQKKLPSEWSLSDPLEGNQKKKDVDFESICNCERSETRNFRLRTSAGMGKFYSDNFLNRRWIFPWFNKVQVMFPDWVRFCKGEKLIAR